MYVKFRLGGIVQKTQKLLRPPIFNIGYGLFVFEEYMYPHLAALSNYDTMWKWSSSKHVEVE